MNRRVLLSVLIATAGRAQEIGKEIPAPAPTGTTPAPYDNPYGPAASGPPQGNPPPPPPAVTATAASTGSGSFGLRASFSFPAVSSPTAQFGVAFFAGDHLKITLDAGLSVAFADNTPLAFRAALGVEPVFRSTAASARPFIIAQVGFGKSFPVRTCTGAFCRTTDNFSMLANLGVGGEYFLSSGFSLNVHALVSLPIEFGDNNVSLGLILFTPGVGATVYF